MNKIETKNELFPFSHLFGISTCCQRISMYVDAKGWQVHLRKYRTWACASDNVHLKIDEW